MRLWRITTVLFVVMAVAGQSLGPTAWAQTESGSLLAITAGQEAGNGDPDIGSLAFITTAAFLGAGALALLLYLVRVRLGFWLHRPPPTDEGGSGDHHRLRELEHENVRLSRALRSGRRRRGFLPFRGPPNC